MLAKNKLLQHHWNGSYWCQWFLGLPCLYQLEPKWKERSYPLLSEKRDCGGFMDPNLGAKRTTKHVWKLQSLNKFEEHIAAPNLSQPAPDKHLNDLQKQGFSAIQEGNAYQPYNGNLQNKVSFDHPTHQPTGWHYGHRALWVLDHWITTIDLMEYQENSTLSSPDDTMLPDVYTDTVACIYSVDGKCKGTLTPERLNILRNAFHRAECSGLHDHVQPPPISFASELVGLIARKGVTRMAFSPSLWLMAIGWWNKNNQCRKLKLNLTQTWEVCMSLDSGMHWSQNQWYCDDKLRKE